MEFSTGSVLSRSLSVLFRNLVGFFVIGLVVYIPLFVVGVILASGEMTERSAMTMLIVTSLLAILLSFLVGLLAVRPDRPGGSSSTRGR